MYKLLTLFLLFATPMWAALSEEEVIRKIQAHLLIKDSSNALQLAKGALKSYPNSPSVHKMYLLSLAAVRPSGALYAAWEGYFLKFPEEAYEHALLEELGWGIISQGVRGGAISSRLIALVGAALTQDVRAVKIIEEGLNASNAALRSVSAELASHFGDARLQKAIAKRLDVERKIEVRTSLIKAVSRLNMDPLIPALFSILNSQSASVGEKIEAVRALVSLQEGLSTEELHYLATHKRAIFRRLAAEIIIHCGIQEEQVDCLKTLASDSHSGVASHALKALGLARCPVQAVYQRACQSVDPKVAVTAAWALLLTDQKEGERILKRFLFHKQEEMQLLAAAALRAAGPLGFPLIKRALKEHPNPYVQVNLALACLELRKELSFASEVVGSFFLQSQDKWMWGEAVSGLFKPLKKSTVRHSPLIPNMPEAVNQKVHLELLNLLAITGYRQAQDLVKQYLKTALWDISGIAAELLLEEGDASAIDLIKALLNDPDPKIQAQAALALAIWGRDHSALPTLIRVYPQADRILKIKILEALGRIGSHEAIPFLVKQFNAPSETLRLIAASILIQTLNH